MVGGGVGAGGYSVVCCGLSDVGFDDLHAAVTLERLAGVLAFARPHHAACDR